MKYFNYCLHFIGMSRYKATKYLQLNEIDVVVTDSNAIPHVLLFFMRFKNIYIVFFKVTYFHQA